MTLRMASQLGGRCIVRWMLSGHHFKDTRSLPKLRYHTSTACLCNTSHQSHIQHSNSSTASQNPPVFKFKSHSAPGIQFNENSEAKLVEGLQSKMRHLSLASPLPSGLYLSPLPKVQYKLPAHVQNELTEQIIVDPALGTVIRECPTVTPDREIEAPTTNVDKVIDMPPFQEETMKQARVTNIILIRRKKMRKHKLKKLRKRMKYLKRIVIANRIKKKRKLWEAHLENFKFKELTEELIETHLAKLETKRNHMTAYLRHEAGLTKKKEKVAKAPLPPVGKITPTPILPPGAVKPGM